MSLNPTGSANYSWNYSKQEREDYSAELYGTVVSIQEVQARVYNPNGQPGAPRFWPDGNPVMNIRIGLATVDGSLKSITFQKAGKKQVSGEKPSLHMQLFNLTNHNMMELIGKTLHFVTWPANPKTGVPWGQGNPRLFMVEVVPDMKYELSGPLPPEFSVEKLYANDAVSGGQMQPPTPNQIQTPVNIPQPMGYQAPMYQQPQPVQQMPMYQQPQPMPMYQPPTTQAYTTQAYQPQTTQAGIDPAIAKAMSTVQQPPAYEQVPIEVYDDMPF